MGQHRSRSKTSYRGRYEYIYEESSSESETEEFRGRSAFRFQDFIPSRSASGHRVVINKAINKHFYREGVLDVQLQFEGHGWPSSHIASPGERHTAHNNHTGCNSDGCKFKGYKKDHSKEDGKKSPHEEDGGDKYDEDKIQKEKQELKKRLKALEDRENREKKDARAMKQREMLDIDLDIAQCNRKLSTLEGYKYQIRRKRSSSRTGVRFDEFKNIFNFTI